MRWSKTIQRVHGRKRSAGGFIFPTLKNKPSTFFFFTERVSVHFDCHSSTFFFTFGIIITPFKLSVFSSSIIYVDVFITFIHSAGSSLYFFYFSAAPVAWPIVAKWRPKNRNGSTPRLYTGRVITIGRWRSVLCEIIIIITRLPFFKKIFVRTLPFAARLSGLVCHTPVRNSIAVEVISAAVSLIHLLFFSKDKTNIQEKKTGRK